MPALMLFGTRTPVIMLEPLKPPACGIQSYASTVAALPATAAASGEKAALTARLAKLKDAGTDELREKAELQEALVRCWVLGANRG